MLKQNVYVGPIFKKVDDDVEFYSQMSLLYKINENEYVNLELVNSIKDEVETISTEAYEGELFISPSNIFELYPLQNGSITLNTIKCDYLSIKNNDQQKTLGRR